MPLPGFLADQLAEHVNGKPMNQLVFTAPDRGPLRNSNFRRDVFDRAAVSVGLRGLTIHDLRHTAASLAIGAGANVKAVQLMLGHASAAMTLDVYAGFSPTTSTPSQRGSTRQLRGVLRPHSGLGQPIGYSQDPGKETKMRSDLRCCVEPPIGVEPMTYALRVRRSSRLS